MNTSIVSARNIAGHNGEVIIHTPETSHAIEHGIRIPDDYFERTTPNGPPGEKSAVEICQGASSDYHWAGNIENTIGELAFRRAEAINRGDSELVAKIEEQIKAIAGSISQGESLRIRTTEGACEALLSMNNKQYKA